MALGAIHCWSSNYSDLLYVKTTSSNIFGANFLLVHSIDLYLQSPLSRSLVRRIHLNVSHFFRPFLTFLIHLGYVAPFFMGVLDSSLLFLPFGNDLLIVILVSRHQEGALLYVLSAACGSTLGVLILALLAGRVGEEGIRKLTGEKRFNKMKTKVQNHGGLAIFLSTLAPPPFPFTMVIATAAALQYSRRRLLALNFLGIGSVHPQSAAAERAESPTP